MSRLRGAGSLSAPRLRIARLQIKRGLVYLPALEMQLTPVHWKGVAFKVGCQGMHSRHNDDGRSGHCCVVTQAPSKHAIAAPSYALPLD